VRNIWETLVNIVNEAGIASDYLAELISRGGRIVQVQAASGGVRMAHTAISTPRFERASHTSSVERVSQSSTDATREYDDGFDFPPTAHPGRELFTFTLFILLIITLLAWGGWKLISLISAWLRPRSKEGRSQAMRFTVTSGVGVTEVVDRPESARAALEHVLVLLGRKRNQVRIFDEDGSRRTPAELGLLADREVAMLPDNEGWPSKPLSRAYIAASGRLDDSAAVSFGLTGYASKRAAFGPHFLLVKIETHTSAAATLQFGTKLRSWYSRDGRV